MSADAQDVNFRGDMEEYGSAHVRVTHVSGRIDPFSMASESLKLVARLAWQFCIASYFSIFDCLSHFRLLHWFFANLAAFSKKCFFAP